MCYRTIHRFWFCDGIMDNVSFVVISFLVISSVDSATIHMGSFSIQYTQIAPTETDGYKIIYVNY